MVFQVLTHYFERADFELQVQEVKKKIKIVMRYVLVFELKRMDLN